MKKYITLFVVAICVMLLVVGCSKKDDNAEESTSIDFPVNSWNDEYPSDFSDDFQMDDQGNYIDPNNQGGGIVTTVPNGNSNTGGSNYGGGISGGNSGGIPSGGGNQSGNVQGGNSNSGGSSSSLIPNNPFISDDDMSKLEQSNAKVYFSDNPNNKYIAKIVSKYGVDANNVIALVKVNAQFPSGMVLEFSGKRDANGELVMTYNELVNVYNIDDTTGKITKASKNGSNDGITSSEGKVTLFLVKNYFIPQLPNLKATMRVD